MTTAQNEDTGPQACLFCKIESGDVDADVVHESPTTIAFRDLNPQAPTHVLVIPRSHHANVADLTVAEPETTADLFRAARVIADDEGLAEGYRLVFNTGAAAHQTVFHAHLHLLGGRTMTWPPG